MMKRRDYVTVARALVRAKDAMTSEHMRQAWQLITQSLVKEIARDNRDFDLRKFKESLTVIYDLDHASGFDPERLNVTVRKTAQFKRGKPERMKEETPQTPQQTPNTLK